MDLVIANDFINSNSFYFMLLVICPFIAFFTNDNMM